MTLWQPVVGHEGRYEVSNLGQVRSLDRVVVNSLGRSRLYRGQPLAWFLAGDGYPTVVLSVGGRARNRPVHQLVAEAFHGPRPSPDHQVRHRDGNVADPSASNVHWGTRGDNQRDSVTHGTHNRARRRRCPAGHALTEENLDGAARRRGWRVCRACRLGRGAVRRARARGESLDVREVADTYARRFGVLPPLQAAESLTTL